MKMKQLQFDSALADDNEVLTEQIIVPELQKLPIRSLSNVKQMLRWISKQNVTDVVQGLDSIASVDEELTIYAQNGYKLVNVFFVGENPEAFGLFYILVHD